MSDGKMYSLTVSFDLNKVDLDKVFEIEKLLHDIGVTFDTGCGGGYRDWEWDWSLKGPVTLNIRED